MIDVFLEFELTDATVDGESVTDENTIPLDEMERWLEVFYANEKYEDEEVDVEVDINAE